MFGKSDSTRESYESNRHWILRRGTGSNIDNRVSLNPQTTTTTAGPLGSVNIHNGSQAILTLKAFYLSYNPMLEPEAVDHKLVLN